MNYDYSEIVDRLLDWYDENRRILPWRENPKPYYVWISEIMLQQTRVEAVKPYFERFIKELPFIQDLAEVEEDKLMKLWEGLGYYSRARNLKKAAMVVMEEYQGELPANYEKLLQLPGIGSYTAGAISSIAYKLSFPAVDGNVLRVTKRVAGSFDDITKQKVKKELEEDLIQVIPKDRPGDFNQSLMELGATVCLPNGKPLCEKCPLNEICKAYKEDTYSKIPVKPAKKPRKIEERTVLLLEYDDSIAIRKREGKGLLSGLWEFPNLEGKISLPDMLLICEENDIKVDEIELLGEAKHIFSHVEWRMIGYKIRLKEISNHNYSKMEGILPFYEWVGRKKIDEDYSIPSAFSAYKEKI
jgi:A/G-specific adenine glycosylase